MHRKIITAALLAAGTAAASAQTAVILYAAYGTIDNKNGAGYTAANNTESGSGNRAVNLGLRHTF